MKKVLLCGHTGSINRGCEAIIRSTVKILRECGVDDIQMLSFAPQDDKFFGIDKIVDIIPYKKKNIFQKAFSYAKKKITSLDVRDYDYLHKCLKNYRDSVIFNVGGDTYCYGRPLISYSMNQIAQKLNIKTVFWGCSVEHQTANDSEMVADINRYDSVFPRENLSYQILNSCITSQTKLYKICDPAFHLDVKATDLPKGFIKNNTVGINVSPVFFENRHDSTDIFYQNIHTLIDYILSSTDMAVCLIPHVYNIKNNTQDIQVLNNIYSKYAKNDRVCIVNTELSCTELKYIISNCRFFIGARTHSTIAAYSSAVPCLALSYSIKSKGIATDLFGTYEGYAISRSELTTDQDLKNHFINTLIKNECEIRKTYEQILPEYKNSIIKAVKDFLTA